MSTNHIIQSMLFQREEKRGRIVFPSFLIIAHQSFLFPEEKKTACADFPHRCGFSTLKAPAELLLIPGTADYETVMMLSAPALSSESNSRCHLHP